MRATGTLTCQIKASLFGVCGKESRATCQYCGRPFCREHGVVLEDGQEICTRKECVAKRVDLQKHLAYKDAVRLRNEARACGLAGCDGELAEVCVRCRGLFCSEHVHRREEAFLDAGVTVRRMATLCRHCAERRAIWVKQ